MGLQCHPVEGLTKGRQKVFASLLSSIAPEYGESIEKGPRGHWTDFFLDND